MSRGRQFPPPPTQDQHMRRLPFHAKVKVNCWSSQQQSLIPPRINTWGNRLFMWKLKLTVDPLNSNCLNSDHWSPPKDQHMRQLPFHTKVKVDCWSSQQWSSQQRLSQQQLLIPPGSTHEVIAFSCESLSWLLILSTAIVDPPPRINTWGNCLFMWKLKLTVDPLNSNPLNSDCRSPPGSTHETITFSHES